MNAAAIGQALGGRRTGRTWMACCPAHDDKVPSLAISFSADGKVLVKCHAGCSQASVVAALRAKGLWDRTTEVPSVRGRSTIPARDDGDAARRRDAAMSIWRAAGPSAGSAVETYLASRGLRLSPTTELRFNSGLSHPSGGKWPGMVALVTRGTDREPIGIHRTFLSRDGSGKAPVVPQKMMLGPCRGGVVRLSAGIDDLLVGEGIETCLAAMQATGRSGWAALSTAGLRALDLPDKVRDITILADGDRPGEVAAQHAARRWLRDGRRVRIARAPAGMDFADLLTGEASAASGSGS